MSNYPIAVFISGTGSNLHAIIKQQHPGNYQVVVVICDHADAPGLAYAHAANIDTHVVERHHGRTDHEQRIQQILAPYDLKLIALAGYMRILSPEFVHLYQQKIINIHPSLLPKYRGLNTHQRVLDAGEREHGCTVHFVTAELDGGLILAQESFAIPDHADSHLLAMQVKKIEHQLLPAVISRFADSSKYQNS